jgi:hypothetical protein
MKGRYSGNDKNTKPNEDIQSKKEKNKSHTRYKPIHSKWRDICFAWT